MMTYNRNELQAMGSSLGEEVAKQESPARGAIRRIEGTITRLEQLLEVADKRLDPILRPDIPKEANKALDPSRAAQSPMTEELFNAQYRAQLCTQHLERLLERLEC